jgi:hypothetical protein
MQNLDVVGAIVATAIVVVAVAVRLSGRQSRLGELAAGVIVGGLAALMVLVLVSDVVPDNAEAVVRPLFFAMISVVIVGGVWTTVARR